MCPDSQLIKVAVWMDRTRHLWSLSTDWPIFMQADVTFTCKMPGDFKECRQIPGLTGRCYMAKKRSSAGLYETEEQITYKYIF